MLYAYAGIWMKALLSSRWEGKREKVKSIGYSLRDKVPRKLVDIRRLRDPSEERGSLIMRRIGEHRGGSILSCAGV